MKIKSILCILKLLLSAILFNAYLRIKIKLGIQNILLFCGFDSDIDLLFLRQRGRT